MNAERAREFLVSLPHAIEAEQFGGLIYWLGDKAIGGKMFAMVNFEGGAGAALTYPAGEERFHELCEREGITPARYLARIFWVSVASWNDLRNQEWEQELGAAHAITLAKLAPRTRAVLALPAAEQKKIVKERRKLLQEREAAKKASKTKAKPSKTV